MTENFITYIFSILIFRTSGLFHIESFAELENKKDNHKLVDQINEDIYNKFMYGNLNKIKSISNKETLAKKPEKNLNNFTKEED